MTGVVDEHPDVGINFQANRSMQCRLCVPGDAIQEVVQHPWSCEDASDTGSMDVVGFKLGPHSEEPWNFYRCYLTKRRDIEFTIKSLTEAQRGGTFQVR